MGQFVLKILFYNTFHHSFDTSFEHHLDDSFDNNFNGSIEDSFDDCQFYYLTIFSTIVLHSVTERRNLAHSK